VKDTTSPAALEAFIKRFGDTFYGDLAKARLADLKQAEAIQQAAKKFEDDARAKAEAERQRLAMLQEQKAEAAKKRAEADAAAPGRVFRDCPDCPEMVAVPAGRFTMGSPADEPERQSDREDRVSVTIAKPFAVGRFAVTRGEYAAFVAATDHSTFSVGCYMTRAYTIEADMSWRSPGFTQTDQHPVVCVNWNDANA
jgi:formylglycine-generating enzyme required for sulfatase activity